MVSTCTRFPFLARTGFQNRAPAEAGSSFSENKRLLSRGRPQELPKSYQDASKSPQRRSKSSKRGLSYSQEDPKDAPRARKEDSRILKWTPKTLQEHQKSYRLIVSYFHSIIIACSHGSAASRALPVLSRGPQRCSKSTQSLIDSSSHTSIVL